MAILCNGELLPYTLFFEDAYGGKYPVEYLWESRSQIQLQELPILKENARIGVRFYSDEEKEYEDIFLRIETSKYKDIEEKEIVIIPIGMNNNFYSLYGEKDDEYPFRMGIYLIELHINGKVYTSAFHVVPLHLSLNQVDNMHQFLNEQVHGIIYDLAYSNKSFGNKEDVELSKFWYYDYARQMAEYYSDFIHGMIRIIKQPKDRIHSTYEPSFNMGKLKQKSIIWNASNKGIVKNRGVSPSIYYYNNIKVNKLDIKENNWLKNILILWSIDTSDVIKAIEEDINVLKLKITDFNENLKVLAKRKEQISGRKNVGENTKRDLNSRVLMTKKDKDRALNQFYILDEWIKLLRSVENKIVYYLNHTFLYDIERNYRKPNLYSYYYKKIDSMYQNLANMKLSKGENEVLTHVLKPTWQVYEYFCLFKVIEVFKQSGFIIVSGLNDNIINYYFEDRIPEGTKFVLEKETQVVHIWYDHYHANSSMEAKANGEVFYTPFPKKKPDIKVDFFDKKDSCLWHKNTIIFDSKFSKFKDIYSSSYNSNTSEQLISYFNFFYTGLGSFQGRPCVTKVICLYAGDDASGTIINKDPITYLKLFPNSHENEEAVGETELFQLIESMLLT